MTNIVFRLLLIVSVLTCAISLSGQNAIGAASVHRLSVGPVVGYDAVRYTTSMAISTMREELVNTSLTAPAYGISALLEFPSRLSLLAEAAFQRLEFTNQKELYRIGDKIAYRKWIYQQDVANADLMVRYTFLPGQPAVFTEAGIFAGFPLSSRISRGMEYGGTSHTEEDRAIDGYDYGFTLGIGARYQRTEIRTRFVINDRATLPEHFTSLRAGIRLAYRFGKAG